MSADITTDRETGKRDTNTSEDYDSNAQDDNIRLVETARWSPAWRNHFLELVMFFSCLSYSLTENLEPTLYMNRSCQLLLNSTENDCLSDINDTQVLRKLEKVGSRYHLYYSVIIYAPSAILNLFIGPWSDKYGRKPAAYWILFSSVVTSCGLVWFVQATHVPLFYVLLTYLPLSFSGGRIGVHSIMAAMASENSSVKSRTIKLTTLVVFRLLANPVGTLASGVMFDRFGMESVYQLSLACNVAAFVCFCFVKDCGVRMKTPLKTMILDFMSLINIKENIQLLLRERDNKGRTKVYLLCYSLIGIALNVQGVKGILFLYCQRMFGWIVLYYSEVYAIEQFCGGVVTIIIMITATRVWKSSDPCIGLTSILFTMAQAIVRAISFHPWIYYVGVVIGLPIHLSIVTVQSQLSKILDKSELGKIFSMISIIETITPMVSSAGFNLVFNATVDFYPGLTFLLGVVSLVGSLLVFVWLVRHTADENRSAPEIIGREIQDEYQPISVSESINA